jgi:hypothetical protein
MSSVGPRRGQTDTFPERRVTEIKFETNNSSWVGGTGNIGCCLAFCAWMDGRFSTEEIIQQFSHANELTQDGRGILERYVSKLPRRPPGTENQDRRFHEGHDTLSNLDTYHWRVPLVYDGSYVSVPRMITHDVFFSFWPL